MFVESPRLGGCLSFKEKNSFPLPTQIPCQYFSMVRIGLLSDTHSYMDDRILHHLEEVDEVWHAGDIGNVAVSDTLEGFKPLRAVYGNIDGDKLRRIHPVEQHFELEGLTVWMTHIAGRPGRYSKGILELIRRRKPDILVCGHSHILKVQRDHQFNLLYMNPGAAGIHGFHKVRTLLRFSLHQGKIEDMEVVELGTRSKVQG